MAALSSSALAVPIAAVAQVANTAFPQNGAAVNPQAVAAAQQQTGTFQAVDAGQDQTGGGGASRNTDPAQSSASAVPATAAQAGRPVQIEGSDRQANDAAVLTSVGERLPPAVPGEYERYVQQVLGRPVQRFGAGLLLPSARNFTPPATASVPPDYRLNPGDEILVGLTGSVQSELRLVLDNDGGVFVPRVGRVSLAGVRYGDLSNVLARKIAGEYRDFRIAVSVLRLHGIRVYVTGFAANPGAYSLNSLSTLVNAVLSSGGPNAGGSFRSIQVRRGGRLIADFDLYDLLLRGDRSHDVVLENEDVVFIAPVGPQVALSGSVNAEAIYEARPGDSVGTLLGFAGGVSTLADPSRTIVSRLSELDKRGWIQVSLADANAAPVERGDIFRLLSVADYARPLERQNILVTIEGEVGTPGHFYLPAGSTMRDGLQVAGGLTGRAFVYGAEFDRSRVQQQQQRGFEEALQQLELTLTATPLTSGALGAEDAAARAQQLVAARAVVERLRRTPPDGRVVLETLPDSTALPLDTVLENNDRLYIPPEPTAIGVFGAVYRPGSFQVNRTRRVRDYIELAGGAQRLADKRDIFVVRANGEVITRRHGGLARPALPGDLVFVPVRAQAGTFWARLRDISQFFFGAGLTAAAAVSLTR